MLKISAVYKLNLFKIIIITLTLFTPVLAFLTSRYQLLSIDAIEFWQLVLLAVGGFYCCRYGLKLSKNNPNRAFWLWAALWWLLLIGRTFNWGRHFLPQYPKLYFHLAVFLPLAAALILPLLLSRKLKAAISDKLQQVPLDAVGWALILLTYFLVDYCDHPHRLGAVLLTNLSLYFPDMPVLEELFEFPFMLALLQMCFYYTAAEKKASVLLSKFIPTLILFGKHPAPPPYQHW